MIADFLAIGIPVPAGLLYYSQLDSVLRVEAKSNEIRALIITRNELASYLANERTLLDSTSSDAPSTEKAAFLPPTTDHAKECKSCYAVDSCMLYRRVSAPPSTREPR
jgi:DNA replication ATP-dependent helicase Dna2